MMATAEFASRRIALQAGFSAGEFGWGVLQHTTRKFLLQYNDLWSSWGAATSSSFFHLLGVDLFAIARVFRFFERDRKEKRAKRPSRAALLIFLNNTDLLLNCVWRNPSPALYNE